MKPKYPVYSMYIDENLHTRTLGALVLRNPASLQEIVYNIHDKYGIYDEIKYTKISKHKVEMYKEILDMLDRYKRRVFKTVTFDRDICFEDYPYISKKIVSSYDNIHYRNVFVDRFPTPHDVLFEDNIMKSHECIGFALREDSKSNKLLQICDLLLGLYSTDPAILTSVSKLGLISYMKEKQFYKNIGQ